MKKRIQIDLLMEDNDFTQSVIDVLNNLKLKAVNLATEKSSIKYHDCGHDEGKPCKNVIEVL